MEQPILSFSGVCDNTIEIYEMSFQKNQFNNPEAVSSIAVLYFNGSYQAIVLASLKFIENEANFVSYAVFEEMNETAITFSNSLLFNNDKSTGIYLYRQYLYFYITCIYYYFCNK